MRPPAWYPPLKRKTINLIGMALVILVIFGNLVDVFLALTRCGQCVRVSCGEMVYTGTRSLRSVSLLSVIVAFLLLQFLLYQLVGAGWFKKVLMIPLCM